MITLVLVISLFIFCSCSSNTNAPEPQSFQRPGIPLMISDQNQAISYIARHFWDSFLDESREYPNDTTELFAGVPKQEVSLAFAEYATYLGALNSQDIEAAQQRLVLLAEKAELRDAGQNFWKAFCGFNDHYFFDPNSPYRNEECYLGWLNAMTASALASEEQRITASATVPFLSLNRLGTRANDFPFTLPDGRKSHLNDIKADYILLFISNPGCQECKSIIDQLSVDVTVTRMMASGSLKVVNVYPDDDKENWKKSLGDYPSEWINCWDETNEMESAYYLRAIPSLYLLGSDYEVLEKDAPIEKILDRLSIL